MFKLAVLCAFLASAIAEPSGLSFIPAPITTYSSVLTPATTSISQQSSSVIHPSPLVYSAPWAYTHFIKKRSAPLLSYPTTYSYISPYSYAAATTPLLASTYSAPVISHAPIAAAPAVHLIKKRSAPLLASTYYASGPYATAAFPYSATYPFTHTILPSTPLISHASIATPAVHLIKKRSAPLLPTTYYTSPPATLPLPYTPIVKSTPLFSQPIASYAGIPTFYTQFIKK